MYNNENIKFDPDDDNGIHLSGMNIDNNGVPWFVDSHGCEDWDICFDDQQDFISAYANSEEEVKEKVFNKLVDISEVIKGIIEKLKDIPTVETEKEMKILEVNPLQLPELEKALKIANEFAHTACNVGFPFVHEPEMVGALLKVSQELIKNQQKDSIS